MATTRQPRSRARPNRRRPIMVATRLTAAEGEVIRQAAQLRGETITDYLRRAALEAAAAGLDNSNEEES